ncbi:MAG: ATPase, partial [Methyloligellaceae bacterium]
MRFKSGEDFKAWPAKAVTVFGMSGLGKTWLANELREHGWFHYSVDYRIGTRYMGEHIVDNFKQEAMKVPLLREMLLTDSIYISSNLRFSNLAPLSTYLGKPGDPAKGGIPFAEYKRRQAQHREAERQAMLDVPTFIQKAHDIYGYDHFICDASGSLCEVVNPDDDDDPVLRDLAASTMLIHLRGTEDDARMLVERFSKAPKPMYYNPDFLDAKWTEYKALKGGIADDAVDPDDFVVWGFEELLRYRLPNYQKMADRHGYTIDAADLAQAKTDGDVLN